MRHTDPCFFPFMGNGQFGACIECGAVMSEGERVRRVQIMEQLEASIEAKLQRLKKVGT